MAALRHGGDDHMTETDPLEHDRQKFLQYISQVVRGQPNQQTGANGGRDADTAILDEKPQTAQRHVQGSTDIGE